MVAAYFIPKDGKKLRLEDKRLKIKNIFWILLSCFDLIRLMTGGFSHHTNGGGI